MSLQNEIDARLAREKENIGIAELAEMHRKEDERQAEFALAAEKMPPLIAVLQELKCKELLEQVWTEIWRCGKIYCDSPSYARIRVTPCPRFATFRVGDSIDAAEATLEMGWSCLVDEWGDARTVLKREFLSIWATYFTGGQVVVKAVSSRLDLREIMEPDAFKVKDFVMEDCVRRGSEYERQMIKEASVNLRSVQKANGKEPRSAQGTQTALLVTALIFTIFLILMLVASCHFFPPS